ncbi:MAG: hypothetical protein IPH12_04085 [Saprospirales bacterium]|nr:hypothetical protein [Saprospirales bacterium]MBK8922547.1 hypothetical protein [Saprospirales bacterium]
MVLLKWLFTLLAILWLIHALRPYFQIRQEANIRQTPPGKDGNKTGDDGEYIDYEEIK